MLAAGVVKKRGLGGPRKMGQREQMKLVFLPAVSWPSKTDVPVFNLQHPPRAPILNTGSPIGEAFGGGAKQEEVGPKGRDLEGYILSHFQPSSLFPDFLPSQHY